MKKLLIANRGEIAVRIIHTAREMGIATVAVASEEDRSSLHVKEADEFVIIGPAESQQSYLKIDAILSAAKKTGADAIHPGFGFLSEKAEFAKAVKDAGLIFVGPSAEIIDLMGDKVRARERMEKAGVPIVPGTGPLRDADTAEKTVISLMKERSDFKCPLLIKAAGGGGGKGMRLVHHMNEFKESFERAQSESLKAFNNPVLFVERYIERPRHLEVQLLGDDEDVIHLFERECSMQRRHQKVIEEAPSPSIDENTRKSLLDRAVAAGKSLNYLSAGTVEFIVSEDNQFYFLEMNTRIQVEHPVSEMITGVDIVAEQLKIARGEKRIQSLKNIDRRGHAIEVRLYAENPEAGYLPSPGPLPYLKFPSWHGIRVDSGVQSPTQISSYYDPMIAKIIAYASTREDARNKLAHYLKSIEIEGLITNRAFLIRALNCEEFKSGKVNTHLLEDMDRWQKLNKPNAKTLALFCLKDFLDRKLLTENTKLSTWQQGF